MILKSVTIDSVSIPLVDEGTGTPLLLVHGFPLDHTMWQHQIEVFKGSHRILAPDLRGFGGAPAGQEIMTMAEFADDLVAVLDAMEVSQPVVLVGLSMGGYVALEMWRRHAERLQGIIFCDTRAAPDSAEVAKGRQVLAGQVQHEGTAALIAGMIPKLFAPSSISSQLACVEQTRNAMRRASPAGVSAAALGMASRSDFRPLLPEIALPCSLICGEYDVITPPAEMEAMASMIPAANMTLIPGAGHMSPLENPEATNRAIREFLRALG